MLLDANLLLYAVDADSPFQRDASQWFEGALNGEERVGLPWQTIGAFVRISTHPRAARRPLSGTAAWDYVAGWLDVPVVWVPPATESTGRIYGELCSETPITGNLVPDAMLAALAIEHGVELMSADGDFARFPRLRWRNPIAR